MNDNNQINGNVNNQPNTLNSNVNSSINGAINDQVNGNTNNQKNNNGYNSTNYINNNLNNNITDQMNNQNMSNNVQPVNNKKKFNWKLIVTIVAIVAAIFIIINLLGGSSSGSKEVGSNSKAIIKNKLYNMEISVGDVQRGVEYTSDSSISFDLDGTFTKVKVTIKNNTSDETNLTPFSINLMDSSKNKITYCSFGTWIYDSKLESEKLPDSVPAKSTISGYVYCETDSNSGSILNINVPVSVDKDNDGNATIHEDEYYFNLN